MLCDMTKMVKQDEMKKGDGVKNSDVDKKGRSPGTQEKDIKSPAKSVSSATSSNITELAYCPCKEYIEGELSIECETCNKYWHLGCVGLQGLTEKMIACLEHWECPDCFLCIFSYKKIEDRKPECTTMKLMIKKELHAIQPVIRATIESAVKNILPKTVCSKEDVQSAVKSYADATQESQRKVVEQAALAQSSKNVVESVVRKLDADKVEREKRRLNVCILNVPEPPKESSSGQKKKEDREFCCRELEMNDSVFEKCWRAGKIDESKPGFCRPLIVQMTDIDAVNEWTRDGKGLQLDSGYWVNKDLCMADRRANFLARQERRKRLKNQSQ